MFPECATRLYFLIPPVIVGRIFFSPRKVKNYILDMGHRFNWEDQYDAVLPEESSVVF
jgi:hypothetical protein